MRASLDQWRLNWGNVDGVRGFIHRRGNHKVKLDINLITGTIDALLHTAERSRPYRMKLKPPPFTASQCDSLIQLLSSKAVYLSDLLNGLWPTNMTGGFTNGRSGLIPPSIRNWGLECSCQAEPQAPVCDHLLQAYEELGEWVYEHPIHWLEIRGIQKKHMLELCAAKRLQGQHDGTQVLRPNDQMEQINGAGRGNDANALKPPIVLGNKIESASARSANLLERIPDPPFWNKEIALSQLLAPVYERAASHAEAIAKKFNGKVESDTSLERNLDT